MTWKMKPGDVFYNTKFDQGLTQSCDFKVGYYKVIEIRDGFFTQNLKPEDRAHYDIRRCTKDGSKLLKYHNAWGCKCFDKWIEEGRLVISR